MSVEMRKVKLNSARIGHTFDAKGQHSGEFAQAVGDEVSMPTDEAARYISRGLASEVTEEKPRK